MSIVFSKNSRRQFLVGTGQTMLALPLLPSLLSSEAKAQVMSTSPRRMMNFAFDHHNERELWLSPTLATQAVGSIGVKERLLSSMGTSSSSVISTVMGNQLYDSLMAKNQITIVRGLRHMISGGTGHVTRAFGGYTSSECGDTSENENYQPSFDYLVELSPSVYGSTLPGVTKNIRIDLDGCWTYVQKIGTRSINPGAYGYSRVKNMYDAVFTNLTNQTVGLGDLTNTRKTNILNRVFPAFQNFKNSRKISSEDKLRLDQHLSFLSDLQKSIALVNQAPTLSCTKPAAPVFSGATKLQVNQVYVDLLAVAFKCGLTQFASINFEAQNPIWLPEYTGGAGFHGVMHGEKGITAQNNGYYSYHRFGYDLAADRFLTQMNIEEGSTGRTYLDNMATTFLSHLGMQSKNSGGNHSDGDVQHTIIGSMGGRLNSGKLYVVPSGLPNNTFIMTLMNLIGVPASEYSKYSSVLGKGFGYYKANLFGERAYSPITEILS